MSDFQPFQPGPTQVFQELGLTNFDVEVSNGSKWVTLNDHFRYIVAADAFKQSSHPRRRVQVNSPVYDGTFEVHSVQENVDETVVVYVLGQSNNEVTENLLNLIGLFQQGSYQLRKRLDDHRETWSCMPAEYTLDRNFVNAHNTRATLTLTVPRLPSVSYEVIL